MDISVLYLSITGDIASKAIREIVKISSLAWNEMNIEQIKIYLVINCSRTDLKGDKLDKVIPTPNRRTMLYSWISSKGTGLTSKGNPQFISASEPHTESQVKKLVGMALSVVDKTKVENHYYIINGQIRKQRQGGAIRSNATGECARLFMIT